jgi:sporulation protein YlmC with PRC-barrel domain
MKRTLVALCISILVLSLFGFASAQQRGEQNQFDRQNQLQQQQQYDSQRDRQQSGIQQRQQQWGRQQGQRQQQATLSRASELMDKKVMNQQGQELGEVKDLVITRNGQVAYLILSRGGVLGMGGDSIPVPFRSADLSQLQDQNAVILANIDKQQLENAPTIGENDLQRLEDPQFQRQVFGYYSGQQQQRGTFGSQQPGMGGYPQPGQGGFQQQQRSMQQQPRQGQMGR